jgi:hypothetical protein
VHEPPCCHERDGGNCRQRQPRAQLLFARRVVSQLQAIGIRSKLPVMERGVFLKRQQGGLKEWPGVQIIMNGARIGASRAIGPCLA